MGNGSSRVTKSVVQCRTGLDSTVQYSIVQCSTVQYRTDLESYRVAE